MEFIWNFWPAYVPAAIVVAAVVTEWAVDAWNGRAPRLSSAELEQARGNVIVLRLALPGASSAPRGSVPAGATPGRVIILREARRRRACARRKQGGAAVLAHRTGAA